MGNGTESRVEHTISTATEEKDEIISSYNKKIRHLSIIFIFLIAFVSFLSVYVYIFVFKAKECDGSFEYFEVIIPAFLTALSGICIFLGYGKLLQVDKSRIELEKSIEEKIRNNVELVKNITKEGIIMGYYEFYQKQKEEEERNGETDPD